MEKFNVRGQQLKKLKAKFILVIFLISLILFTMEFGFLAIYPLLKDSFLKVLYIETNLYRYIFYIVYILIMTSINIILIVYLWYINNKEFRKEYINVIFNECKLDEVYLLNNNVKFSSEDKQYIQSIFNIEDVSLVESFSDASDKYSIDINTIKYYIDEKRKYGTLLNVNLDHLKSGFIKISKQFFIPFDEYKNQRLLQYGFSYESKLKKYNMISSYGKLGYKLEDNEKANSIISLENFFKRSPNIIMDNKNIYIFIPDFKFYYTNGLFKLISNSVFDDKIKALKTFHDIWLNLVTILDTLFPNQN